MTNEIIRKIDDMIADLYTLKLWVHTEQKKDSSSNSEPEENSLEEPQSESSIPPPTSEGPIAEPRKVIHRRTNRSFPLNKSKNLNDEQRNKVLAFANENKQLILDQPSATRNEFLQKLVHDKLNINLSAYMSGKIITMLSF